MKGEKTGLGERGMAVCAGSGERRLETWLKELRQRRATCEGWNRTNLIIIYREDLDLFLSNSLLWFVSVVFCTICLLLYINATGTSWMVREIVCHHEVGTTVLANIHTEPHDSWEWQKSTALRPSSSFRCSLVGISLVESYFMSFIARLWVKSKKLCAKWNYLAVFYVSQHFWRNWLDLFSFFFWVSQARSTYSYRKNYLYLSHIFQVATDHINFHVLISIVRNYCVCT